MQCLIPWLPLSTERSGPLGEQEHRRATLQVQVEASRGNPGSAVWVYAEGGMVLFLCLLLLMPHNLEEG